MKILKSDGRRGGLRVVEKIAIIPKRIFQTGQAAKWIWFKKYYELQRNSWHLLGWIEEENSLNEHEWDFKWSEEYLKIWK